MWHFMEYTEENVDKVENRINLTRTIRAKHTHTTRASSMGALGIDNMGVSYRINILFNLAFSLPTKVFYILILI
jgi:hypothetical protein